VIECQCHRVTTQDALRAAASGCHHVRDVVRATRAGTDCGGCIPQLKKLCDEWRRAHEVAASEPVDLRDVAV
jgi:NAD(P)H-nitrite reductase large subunit